jgi:hypothetical protein
MNSHIDLVGNVLLWRSLFLAAMIAVLLIGAVLGAILDRIVGHGRRSRPRVAPMARRATHT